MNDETLRAIEALKALIDGKVGLKNVHKQITFPVIIAALEQQIKEPCESCEQWECVDAKYCPECGRKLEG